jgi:hypothetical protein
MQLGGSGNLQNDCKWRCVRSVPCGEPWRVEMHTTDIDIGAWPSSEHIASFSSGDGGWVRSCRGGSNTLGGSEKKLAHEDICTEEG